MAIQKHITLQVNNSIDQSQPDFSAVTPPKACDINIQVANGWAITGHYQNYALQAVTLQKSTATEAN